LRVEFGITVPEVELIIQIYYRLVVL